jgi:hypothetical protein
MQINSVMSNVLHGVLVDDILSEEFISQERLIELIKLSCERPYLRFYNRIFDENSHIFKIKDTWYFWHDVNEELQKWNWKNDIQGIIEQNLDLEELDMFNNGWSVYDEGDYCMNAIKDILKL